MPSAGQKDVPDRKALEIRAKGVYISCQVSSSGIRTDPQDAAADFEFFAGDSLDSMKNKVRESPE